jgi:hypothetical protein
VCGVILVELALQLWRSGTLNRRAAHRLFAFSILYLFVLFSALLVDNVGNRLASTPPGRALAMPDVSLQRHRLDPCRAAEIFFTAALCSSLS